MPFTDDDRKMLVSTHTKVDSMEKNYDRQLSDQRKEDEKIHKRIDQTHHRINNTNKLFYSVMAVANAAWGGFLAYFKMKG